MSSARRERIMREAGYACWFCGTDIIEPRHQTIDHLVPVSRGGGNRSDNLVPACPSCNARKRDDSLEAYRARTRPGKPFFGETRVWRRRARTRSRAEAKQGRIDRDELPRTTRHD